MKFSFHVRTEMARVYHITHITSGVFEKTAIRD